MSTTIEEHVIHRELWLQQLHATLIIAKKDMLIYYLKPPVIIFGVIFPIFFFLAFAVGRSLPLETLLPGMLAMTLFFTASAVGAGALLIMGLGISWLSVFVFNRRKTFTD